jgi:ATP-binding cassette subfamily C protein
MKLRREAQEKVMPRPRNELASALRACRSAIVGIAFASALINVLYLSGSVYMLEVYDRVLTSRSIPTLVGLTVLIVVLYAFQGFLDLLRGRVLVRIGRSLGESLSMRVYSLIGQLALSTRSSGDGLQPLRDIDQVRAFLSSPGPVALLDLPWMPFYIAICFLFHFWIGLTALVGALLIVSLTLLTELLTREPQKIVTELSGQRQALAEASRRNAEALQAMGMAPRVAARWSNRSCWGSALIWSSSRRRPPGSSSPVRSWRGGRSRRSTSRSPTGAASSRSGRAGGG